MAEPRRPQGEPSLREHAKEELSHYSKRTVDIEYDFPFAGFAELEGIANRTDFDLKQHEQHAGKTLQYFDEPTNEHIVPYVIEPAMGVDRCFLTVLIDAYAEEEVKGEKRVVLRLKPAARARQGRDPAAFPQREARADRAQGLGPPPPPLHDPVRRRAEHRPPLPPPGRDRHPLCVTVDFDTLEDDAVTIRDRDEMTQDRVPIANLVSVLREKLPGG